MNLYTFILCVAGVALLPVTLVLLKFLAGIAIPFWVIGAVSFIVGFTFFITCAYHFLKGGQLSNFTTTKSGTSIRVRETAWTPALYDKLDITKLAGLFTKSSPRYSYNSLNPRLSLEFNQTVVVKVVKTNVISVSDIRHYQLIPKNFLGFAYTELSLHLKSGEGYSATYRADEAIDEKIHEYFAENGVEKI